MIVFDEGQSKILRGLEDHPGENWNFVFTGASGTGKTLMGIKCIHGLLKRYQVPRRRGQGLKNVYVYAVSARGKNQRTQKSLLKFYEENLFKSSYVNEETNVQIVCKDIINLCNQHIFTRVKNEHLYSIGSKVIEALCQKLCEGSSFLF